MTYPECERCGKVTPKASFIVNASCAVFKAIVGLITGSKGLVADGVHSGADAVSSLFILISLKISARDASHKHHYGYGKIEYITSLMAGIFLFAGASSIFLSSIQSFVHGTHKVPGNMAIIATIISIVTSYLMYDSSYCAGKQLNSPALMADALESRADSISAFAVLAGLIGTKLGIYFADSLSAIIVSVLIFRMSFEMFEKSAWGLMDSSLDEEVLNEIKDSVMKVRDIMEVTYIRSRSVGQRDWVDIGIKISPGRTVEEAHDIAEFIKRFISDKYESIGTVSVHYSHYNCGLLERVAGGPAHA